ncbi:MAG: AI-2E family transporter [Ktedonobacteraceae bacterium]|nr:AI-2E family transporter [Ktedonobacteraceae bacterium]
MGQVNWQRTRDILLCVICIGIIFWASWSVLGQFVDAILIFLLSMAVAFLVTPAVNLLVKNGIPRLLAALVVYVVVLAVLAGLFYELVFSLIQQVQAVSDTVVAFFNNLPGWYGQVYTFLLKQGIPQANIDSAVNQIRDQAVTFARSAATNALNILFILSNLFINLALVTVLSFYLTLDGKRIRDSIIGIAPKRSLSNVLLFEDALNRVVGNYIRGQLTLALIIGTCAGAICLVTGLGNYALIVGVLGFLFETIPMVGPFLASIPAILLSLLLPDPFPRTFWIIALFIMVQMLESNVLGPRIVGHAVGLHPVAAILALLVGAKMFGALGALLATPAVAVIWVVIASIYRSARGESPDVMLANKRAPWTLRRPKRSLYRAKRATGEDGESGDDNVDASVALPYSETSDVIDAYDEKIKNP